jgi:hypothetical protein
MNGLRALAVAFLMALAAGCHHKDGDSIAVTGDGTHLSADAIDKDPIALLPAQPVAVAELDAQALFQSQSSAQLTALATRYLPFAEQTGIVPQRDIKRIFVGVYSLAGADVAGVVQGDFQVDRIRSAADQHAMTPLGVPLSRTSYANNDVYTAGNVGFCILTPHTLLVGNQTGIRRALDRIRDNRLHRDVPDWVMALVDNPKASLVVAGDLSGQPQVAATAQSLPFLNGVKSVRMLGNFQPPGINFAGALTYPDAVSASTAAGSLRTLGQVASLAGAFSAFGFGTPLKSLQVQVAQTDVQFTMAVDAQTLVSVIGRFAASPRG